MRHLLRRLWFQPAFSITVVATLALGIGASTMVLALARAVLFTVIPYGDPDRLVVLTPSHPGQGLTDGQGSLSYVEFEEWRRRLPELELAAFHSGSTGVSLNLTGAGETERVHVNFVSSGFFAALDVSVAAGRGFAIDEGSEPGAGMVAVISDGMWRRRFGGAAGAVGSTLHLDGKPITVVGIAPPGFQPLAYERAADLWVPIPAVAELVSPFYLEDRRARWLGAVGRLPRGVSLAALRPRLDALALALEQEYPELNAGWRIEAVPVAEHLLGRGELVRSVGLLAGGAAFLLLIGGINITTLMIVATRARRGEFALRVALGAGAPAIARQLLAEALVACGLGAGLGALAAVWLTTAVVAWSPLPLPSYIAVSVDGTVLGLAALLALALAIALAIGPALVGARAGAGGLRAGARAGETRHARRWRELVATVQTFAAAILLIGAGILATGHWRLHTTEPGYRTEGLFVGRVQLGADATPDARRAFYDRLLAQLDGLAGAEGAALWAASLPGDNWRYWEIVPEGRAGEAPEDRIVTFVHRVSPGALRVLGVPLVRGRGIEATDRDGSRAVAVVSESFAAATWPGEDPIGKRYRVHTAGDPDAWIEVVGVAADAYQRGRNERGGSLIDSYYPLQQRVTTLIGILVRAGNDREAAEMAPAVRRTLADIAPGLPLFDVGTMSERRAAEEHGSRFRALLVSALAVAAAGLAVIGAYGAASESAQQRRRELGVRRALGARDRDVVRTLLARPLALALVGLAAGGAVGARLSPLLDSLLDAGRTGNGIVVAGTLALLAAATVLAAWLPTRRALRDDPQAVIRDPR